MPLVEQFLPVLARLPGALSRESSGLGRVHGEIGVAQDLVGVKALAIRPPDTGARRDMEVEAANVEGLVEGGHGPPGEAGGVLPSVEALDEEHELVASQPGDGVGAPGAAPQSVGDGDQEAIALVVAEAVVSAKGLRSGTVMGRRTVMVVPAPGRESKPM